MLRTLMTAGTLGLALLACAEKNVANESTAGASETSTTAGPGSTATSAQPTSTSTGANSTTAGTTAGDASTAATGMTFLFQYDLGPLPPPCDTYTQDCARGEKCTVFSYGGGGAWDATKCVAVTGDKKPGEVCIAEDGGYSGVDDCEKGAICWDVDLMGMGTCRAFCTGAPEAPTCAIGWVCQSGRLMGFCIPLCDPLLQDCPDDDFCIANGYYFECSVDGSGDAGKANDPCWLADDCDKGLACVNAPASSAACDQGFENCCQPFCKFIEGQDGDCPNADQKCLQWYDPMMPIPPGYEDVGICGIPK